MQNLSVEFLNAIRFLTPEQINAVMKNSDHIMPKLKSLVRSITLDNIESLLKEFREYLEYFPDKTFYIVVDVKYKNVYYNFDYIECIIYTEEDIREKFSNYQNLVYENYYLQFSSTNRFYLKENKVDGYDKGTELIETNKLKILIETLKKINGVTVLDPMLIEMNNMVNKIL